MGPRPSFFPVKKTEGHIHPLRCHREGKPSDLVLSIHDTATIGMQNLASHI